MKKDISKSWFFLSLLLLFCSPSIVFSASMSDYCQIPPFIGTGGEPNILFVYDVSGSMSNAAYSGTYNAGRTYEGYFDPTKQYVQDVDGIYQEASGLPCTSTCDLDPTHVPPDYASPPGFTCVRRSSNCSNAGEYGSGDLAFGCSGTRRYGCCYRGVSSGDCGTLTVGNRLNFNNMRRIDLQRWALTGGRPSSCVSSNDANFCDPELWSQTGNTTGGRVGTVCNDSLDVNGDGIADGGCILQAHNGVRVKVRWNRVYAGLIYQVMTMPIRPRVGAMAFDTNGDPYIRTNKVYVGDYLNAPPANASFPYMNFITSLNSEDPSGYTPTGPAMWDALNYFKQTTPQYGGFAVQTSSADAWKNPLYACDENGANCVLNTCARNFVVLVSDGEWNTPSSTIGTSPGCASNSSDPAVPAYCMHMGFNNAMGGTSSPVFTRVNNVYTVGLFMNSVGLNAMKNVAMYGGFENSALTWPSGRTGYPTSPGSLSSPIPVVPPSHTDWDRDGDGVPDTFFSAEDALQMKQSLMDVIQDILARTTSGTAASVLASGEGSGANLVQATYYPKRRFFSASAEWVGGLQNLWYYIDPRFNNSSIREDTNLDKVLDLRTDQIASMFFNESDQKAEVNLLADANGDGAADSATPVKTVEIEELNTLWEAGVKLWNRDSDDRTIYTTLTSVAAPLTNFAASNAAVIRPFLNTDDGAASGAENNQLATNIINYVRGTDIANYTYASGARTEVYRQRELQIDLNGDGDINDLVTVNGVSMNETTKKVWKLGDIINSTPKIASWVKLNDYDTRYKDNTYNTYVATTGYKSRGTVFVGANDGMLHAFNLGTLELSWVGQTMKYQKARLTGNVADLGKEMWGFVPMNVLPYLKYLKETDYCHISSVDLTPYIFDASIGDGSPGYWNQTRTVNSWRTIVIGGMRLGGACKDTASTCTDCVKTPVTGKGYSAYFALDVTDPANPQFLWEYSHPELGFSTSGPAIVKILARNSGASNSTADPTKNGRWFVVFGSGPTGPIDPVSQKFLGRSDQNLKFFILDLATGQLATSLPMNTGIATAFAGSLVNATLDVDEDYQDDVVYIPYVKKSGTTWTEGGILRLMTNEDSNGNNVSTTGDTALNPANWKFNSLIDNIGPVTSAVVKAYDPNKNTLRIFFGAGRYFYKKAGDTDDQDGLRRLYGVLDPCWQNGSGNKEWVSGCLDNSSPQTRTTGELDQINLACSLGTTNLNSKGWYIDLEGSGSYNHDGVIKQYYAERDITDPLATAQGMVYFTTFKPYNQECSIGGKSFLWAVFGETGGAGGTLLRGTALLQVSTGAVEQKNLKTAFSDMNGRRTGSMEGVPPTGQGLALITTPNPVRRILYMRER